MNIGRIEMNYIPVTYGAKNANQNAVFSGNLEGANKQYAPESVSAGTEENMSLTELYYRMRWGLTDEKEKQEHSTPVQKTDANEAADKGQADLKAGKVSKTQDEENEDEKDEESRTDTNIIVKPDGSRVLVVTTTIGDMETTMSLEISKPTDMPNGTSEEERGQAEGKADENSSSNHGQGSGQ